MNEKKGFVNFLVTTIIGGLVFLVPLGMLVYIGKIAVDFMMIIAEPMAGIIPIDTVGGVALANLIALAVVIVICFIAGFFLKGTVLDRLIKSLENKVLINIPGYSMIRGIKSGFDSDETAHMRPVVLKSGASERIGLEIDQLEDGRSMIYIPSNPSAWSGITMIMPPEEFEYLAVPAAKVMELTEKFGHGVGDVLATRQDAPPAVETTINDGER